jgi:hypothetical protein
VKTFRLWLARRLLPAGWHLQRNRARRAPTVTATGLVPVTGDFYAVGAKLGTLPAGATHTDAPHPTATT